MIVLIGFMGAGKSTVGRLLAARLGLPFVDTDEVVTARAGMSIADIFAAKGEPGFRELEREAAYDALQGPDGVVSLGGGTLADPMIRTELQGKSVVHLEVSYREAMRRVGDDGSRPMLGRDTRTLFREREPVYKMLATSSVQTEGKTPDEVAFEIGVALSGGAMADDRPRRIPVPLKERAYEVVVGRALLEDIAAHLPELESMEKAFVITHEALVPQARAIFDGLQSGGLSVHPLLVGQGETAKSLEVASVLYDSMAEAGAHRHDLVVGFGGGVVTDLAGFVASTYARGMAVAHVPTTLLGQVDAAIGGKTAVNLLAGKNLVGTFHQPVLVLCDVDVLASLPIEEMRAGMAEVIKYGFISDPDLLRVVESRVGEIYAGDVRLLVDVVARCAAIKAQVVAADEREQGSRAFLNYGHTFAHAIEKARAFSGVRHGEAVALGMMAAAYLAFELGRIDESVVALHRRVLEEAGLPTSDVFDLPELEDSWALDKKYRGGVRFVLLKGVGRPEAGVEAPRDALLNAIRRLSA